MRLKETRNSNRIRRQSNVLYQVFCDKFYNEQKYGFENLSLINSRLQDLDYANIRTSLFRVDRVVHR